MKIVFIGIGNACRSALAEVILRQMLDSKGIVGVDIPIVAELV